MGEPVEEELLSLYADQFLRGTTYTTHLRLGQPRGFSKENPAPEDRRRLLLSTLPEADIVERTPTEATIYEFGIWRPQTKIGQLLVYSDLLPSTPGYFDLTDEDISLVLVTTENNPAFKDFAQRMEVDYQVFQPPTVLAKVAARRGGS